MLQNLFTPEIMSWIIWPIFIVIARILDVSIGTVRVIFIVKGLKRMAPLLGFFEVMIWLFVITRVVKEINNPACYVAYPLGFALGNYIGMLIEDKLSIGNAVIRVITRREAPELVDALIKSNFHVTSITALSDNRPVKIIFSVVNKKMIVSYLKIVKKYNPKAFYTIEDVKLIENNSFHTAQVNNNKGSLIKIYKSSLFKKGL